MVMKNVIVISAALLMSVAAAAQNGTNSGNSQELQKPRTGRNDQVITSPDINAAITGTTSSTTGQPADVAGGTTAVAGTASASAMTTADVSTRETLDRQRLMQLVGKTQPSAVPELPRPAFIDSSSEGKAQNGRNQAELSRRGGLQQGPATDNGPQWANRQLQAQPNNGEQPQPQQQQSANQQHTQAQAQKRP
jgi:hypothetical protein